MSRVTPADLRAIAVRSAKIALVVGPVLTAINQWETIVAFQTPNMAKVALTFLVPFCVSFFSGYTMRKSLAAQICASQSRIATLRSEAEFCAARARAAERALRKVQQSTPHTLRDAL